MRRSPSIARSQRAASPGCPAARKPAAAEVSNRTRLVRLDRRPARCAPGPPSPPPPRRCRASARADCSATVGVVDGQRRGHRRRAQAIAAGTASMTTQKLHASVSPSVASAWSTSARAASAIGRGEDHRPVDALHQVHGDHRPARQRQGALEQPPCLLAVALLQPDLGQPLQAVRLTGGGVDVAVQVDRLDQLALGAVEVAHQQRRLADQGARERDAAQRSGAVGVPQQVLRLLDDLLRRAPVRRGGTRPRTGGRRTARWPAAACRGCGAAPSGTARTTHPGCVRPGPAARSGP